MRCVLAAEHDMSLSLRVAAKRAERKRGENSDRRRERCDRPAAGSSHEGESARGIFTYAIAGFRTVEGNWGGASHCRRVGCRFGEGRRPTDPSQRCDQRESTPVLRPARRKVTRRPLTIETDPIADSLPRAFPRALLERARLYNPDRAVRRRFRTTSKGMGFHNFGVQHEFAISLCAMTMLGVGAAQAQVDLKTYADANGNLDIQALTCAQLAGTWQEDADFMTGLVQRLVQRPGGLQQVEGRSRQGTRAPRHRLLQGPSRREGHQGDGYQHQADAQGSRHQGQRREVASLAIDGKDEGAKGGWLKIA
jgi:hypothetical protein